MADPLPSGLARERRGVKMIGGKPFVPLYCINCGADGGLVDEAGVAAMMDHAYICEPCADKWGELFGASPIPDEIFWGKLRAAQMEKYGRMLTDFELVEALKDEHSMISKLARERTTK